MTEVAEQQYVPVPRSAESSAKPQVKRSAAVRRADSYESRTVAARPAISSASFGRDRRCAYARCHQPLPQQTGPGRPRRFCSPECRQRAGRHPRSIPTAPPPVLGKFSRRLRGAIKASGLKLGTIVRRMREEDGIEVSASTLSNWQCGNPPRRISVDDDERIYALERVLKVRRGELLLLLDQERPHRSAIRARRSLAKPDDEIDTLRRQLNQRGGTFGYITTAVSEVIRVGADHRELLRTVCQTVRAIEEGTVDCYWAFYSADMVGASTDVKGISGCRPGRYVPVGDIVAMELLFDRLLPRGASHTFQFGVVPRSYSPGEPCVRRSTGQPTLEQLDMIVQFDAPPAEAWTAEWPARGERPTKRERTALSEGAVQLHKPHPVPGIYGLGWSW